MFSLLTRASAMALIAAMAFGSLMMSSSASVPTREAYAPVKVSAPAAVLYSGCHDFPYYYSVDADLGMDWWMTLTVYRPDGLEYQTDEVSEYPSAGEVTVSTVCNSLDGPGRYFIRGTFNWRDDEFNVHTYSVPKTYLVLRRPRTKTILTASDRTPHRSQIVTMRVESKVERPVGWYINNGADIALQIRQAGRWKRVETLYSNRRGVATFRWRSTGTRDLRWRAVTTAGDYDDYTSSRSKIVTIRR